MASGGGGGTVQSDERSDVRQTGDLLMRWGELRSLTERTAHEPQRIDAVTLWLALWPAEQGREEALHYAVSKLGRVMCSAQVSVGEVLAWCMEGLPALRERMGRFHSISDRGVERWLAVLSWALVVSQQSDIPVCDIQVTASLEVNGGEVMRQLYMMVSHDELVYLLDVHQGPQHICMGIAGRQQWSGFEQTLRTLAWGDTRGIAFESS